VVFDEAAKIPEEARTDVFWPTLADRRGQAFLISTPAGQNWFWELWRKGLEDGEEYASFKAPSFDNPMPGIREAYKRAKEIMPERAFAQEWQAEFIPDAMVLFEPDWFSLRYDPAQPYYEQSAVARFFSWDTGLKDKDGSAYSACVVADLMPDYRMQVREVYRDRLSFPALINAMEQLAYKWRGRVGRKEIPMKIIIEDKASGTSAYQTIIQSADPWLSRNVISFQPSTSKQQRAAQAGIWCKNGSVLLPAPNTDERGQSLVPWLYAFEQELVKAPKGAYMDQVDAFSQLVIIMQSYLQAGLRLRKSVYGSEMSPIQPMGLVTPQGAGAR
jgi:predicted phage terminase large subunit-like protein